MSELREKIVVMIYESLPYSTTDSIRANVDEIVDLIGPKWVPVKERLPEGKNVILVYDGGAILMDFFNGSTFRLRGVTHWAPLPAPPKGDPTS